MSISKIGISPRSALICGLILLIAGAGSGCEGRPKVQAEVEQPEIIPPKLVHEGAVEQLQLQHNSLPDMVLL